MVEVLQKDLPYVSLTSSFSQVLVIREKLAELYESEREWSKAAQMLSGIDLDSGIRSEFVHQVP